jgi:ribonuclease Z
VQLVFLGTSAGAPTRERNVTSQALVFASGDTWLFDCGEATQHQILRTHVRPQRIRKILLTHLHGDHCYGLPGILASMGLHGATEAVEVIAPPGARRFMETALDIAGSSLPFPWTVRELTGETTLQAEDGTRLRAVPIVHRVPCFGYVVETPTRRGKLDPELARARGVTHGPELGRLAHGEDVRLADGRLLRAAEVLGPPRRGARIIILGDTSDASAVVAAGRGCDVLVHEATYAEDLRDKALTYGHSTAQMAGALAQALAARTLILTHFSARYTAPGAVPAVEALVSEARRACPETEVVAAHDLFTFDVRPAPAP